jgi:hypothetical protein
MPETKYCPACKALKELTEFNVNRAKRDGRATYCIPCNRAISRARYEARRDHYKSDASRRKKDAISANKRRVWEYLCEHPCVDCGETDPIVLEFDHLRDKVRAVSALVARGVGWPMIECEIEKWPEGTTFPAGIKLPWCSGKHGVLRNRRGGFESFREYASDQ